jgi:hypothetical protein
MLSSLVADYTTCILLIALIHVTKNNDFFNKCWLRLKEGKHVCKCVNKDSNCLINGWNISHILFNFIITYKNPNYWFHIITIGCMWEVLEILFGVCDSVDISCNMIGVFIALVVRQ